MLNWLSLLALAADLSPEHARRLDEAHLLVQYDRVAWLTSDVATASPPDVLERLGAEWFVLFREDHAIGVYGRLQGPFYDAAVRLRMADGEPIVPTHEDLPDAELLPRARAIAATWAAPLPRPLQAVMDRGVQLNHYVLVDDRGVTVWLIPALTDAGELLYGSCGRFTYDATGQRLLSSHVEKRPSRSLPFDPEADIVLRSADRAFPTTCEAFWADYHGDGFASLTIRSREADLRFIDEPKLGYIPVITRR